MVQNGRLSKGPYSELDFSIPEKMVHFGPFWSEEVHFGPFRSANHTLAIPRESRLRVTFGLLFRCARVGPQCHFGFTFSLL